MDSKKNGISRRQIDRVSKRETENDLREILNQPGPSRVLGTENASSEFHNNINPIHYPNDSPDRTSYIESDIYSSSEEISSSVDEMSVCSYDSNKSIQHFDNGDNIPHTEPCSLEAFKTGLMNWSIKEKIKQSSMSKLLKFLKSHHGQCFSALPSDARTLLNTPRHVRVENISGGSFIYFGLKESLFNILSRVVIQPNSIKLLIGIDGLPISKSSGNQLWPQLGRIENIPEFPVFVIGLFHGTEKPHNSNEYLRKLVDELGEIMHNGLDVKGNLIAIERVGFVCDVPARSYVLKTKGHTGFFSCFRCDVEGDSINGTVCFPFKSGNLRTHESFLNKIQVEHHTGGTATLLEELPNFDIIHHMPLDYMHLVCLGVVKKLLNLWLKGSLQYRIPSRVVKTMSSFLISFKKYVPSEFSRKPRGLDEVARWKATEFRQFLIYTGPVILMECSRHFSKKIVKNFFALSVALTILLNPTKCFVLQGYAKSLLEYFVKTFASIYGRHKISHNVHSILHLADDVSVFGPLDICSAFHFENHMQQLKKRIRKPHQALQQVFNRLMEEIVLTNSAPASLVDSSKIQKFKNRHSERLHLVDHCTDPQYKCLNFKDFCLKCNGKDCYCMVEGGTVVKIKNFAYSSHFKEIVVIGKSFKTTEDFFLVPCKSSKLNIFTISSISPKLDVWKVSSIKTKLFVIPFKSKLVAFPLLHV